MHKASTHYEILGVSSQATPDEIKAAFRQQAKLHHPDVNGGSAEATQRFARLNEAHECLSDPLRRQEYDYVIGVRVRPGLHQAGPRMHWQHPPSHRRPAAQPQQAAQPANVSIGEVLVGVAVGAVVMGLVGLIFGASATGASRKPRR